MKSGKQPANTEAATPTTTTMNNRRRITRLPTTHHLRPGCRQRPRSSFDGDISRVDRPSFERPTVKRGRFVRCAARARRTPKFGPLNKLPSAPYLFDLLGLHLAPHV